MPLPPTIRFPRARRRPCPSRLATATALLLASVLLLASALAMAALPPAAAPGPRQLVVVTTTDWDASDGLLRHYERAGPGAPWRQVGGFAVSIGREGAAWGEGLHAAQDQDDGPVKREGDGRSPAGMFAIGEAFGYLPAARVTTPLPYVQMDAGHYCMDVPDSPLYNRIVHQDEVGAAAVAGSTEPMRLDLHRDGDPRYRLGLVIGHNPGNRPGGGSCIFAHLWRHPGEATSGCTAMAEADMRQLQAWLDPAAMPRFVLLPRAQYQRLAVQWRLPAPAPAPTP